MKKKKIFLIILLFTILLISFIIFKILNKNPLIDKWEGKGNTIYEFKTGGKGVMSVPLSDYEFTYKVSDNSLEIDYKSKKADDAKYKYSIKKDKLTLKGSRGTFMFTKKDK